MARILAIDYGKKRTGVAVTDPLQIIANSLTTVLSDEIFSFLDNYFQKEDVECVVVGFPKQMDGKESESVKYIKPFLRELQKRYPQLKIEKEDERFTSKIAFQTMVEGGVKKQKRRDKALVDAISATIILQSFMERKKNLS